jgi:hypothetical protein
MIVMFSIINHNIPKELLLSIIKNIKKFCNPNIITYSDYDYKLNDTIAVALPESTDKATFRFFLSFKYAYKNKVDKIIFINSRQMFFKSAINIIKKYDFASTFVAAKKTNNQWSIPNPWLGYYIKNPEKIKKLERFIGEKKIFNKILFSGPTHGFMGNKEFIKYFYKLIKKENYNVDDIYDEIYLSSTLASFFRHSGIEFKNIPTLKIKNKHNNLIECNFDNNMKQTEADFYITKLNKFKLTHNLMIWGSYEFKKDYKIPSDKSEKASITTEILQDLILNKKNYSAHYCSAKRFSSDPNNLVRKKLE